MTRIGSWRIIEPDRMANGILAWENVDNNLVLKISHMIKEEFPRRVREFKYSISAYTYNERGGTHNIFADGANTIQDAKTIATRYMRKYR